MIARELTEFFAAFAPDGRPVLQGPGDAVFLSNVNACYRRDCWEEIRFPDVPYAEDQAFARAMLGRRLEQGLPARRRRCSTRTTTARWSSCAATSTSTAGCARRSATWSRSRRAAWSGVTRAPGGRRPALDARALVAGRPARALDGALGAPPLEPAAVRRRSARAPSACPPRVQRRDLAGGPRPAARDRRRDGRAPRLRGAALGGGGPALAGGAGAARRRRCPGWRRASGCTWRW